MDIEEQNKLFI